MGARLLLAAALRFGGRRRTTQEQEGETSRNVATPVSTPNHSTVSTKGGSPCSSTSLRPARTHPRSACALSLSSHPLVSRESARDCCRKRKEVGFPVGDKNINLHRAVIISKHNTCLLHSTTPKDSTRERHLAQQFE